MPDVVAYELALFVSLLQEDEHLSLPDIVAYIVVYAMNDRSSFQHAVEILQDIRREEDQGAAVIMVANKSDLVRKRKVNAEGQFDRCMPYWLQYSIQSV